MAGPFAPALRTLERGNRPEPPLGFFIVAGHRGDCHLAAEPLPVPVRLLLPADHVLSPGRGQSITAYCWRASRRPASPRPSSARASSSIGGSVRGPRGVRGPVLSPPCTRQASPGADEPPAAYQSRAAGKHMVSGRAILMSGRQAAGAHRAAGVSLDNADRLGPPEADTRTLGAPPVRKPAARKSVGGVATENIQRVLSDAMAPSR